MTTLLKKLTEKFNCNLKMGFEMDKNLFLDLERFRVLYHKMGLINGDLVEGLHFGSLSKRSGDEEFIITGANTYQFPILNSTQYTRVIKAEIKRNKVEGKGPIAPSQLSLLHYLTYQSNPHIKCVMHFNHENIWKYLVKEELIIDKHTDNIDEFKNLLISIETENPKCFAFEASAHSIIFIGKSVEEVGRLVLDTYRAQIN